MGKVVEGDFPPRYTFGEETAETVLKDAARARLEIAIVLGITEMGEPYFTYSREVDEAEVYFLLHKAASAVLEGGE